MQISVWANSKFKYKFQIDFKLSVYVSWDVIFVMCEN